MPPPTAKRIGRVQAAQGVTLGLGLAYAVGAVAFAPTTQRLAPGWVVQVDFGPSLVLAAGLGAWFGRCMRQRLAG